MVFETLKNVVKQKSMYFVICPKQGPYMGVFSYTA